jgi:hypothetical protein
VDQDCDRLLHSALASNSSLPLIGPLEVGLLKISIGLVTLLLATLENR